MVADIVREVAGDHAQVTGLMGEGVDPHLYKPTNKDSRAVLGADMVFYNGLMLEGRMGDAMTKAGRKGVDVYAVTEELDEQFLLEPAAMAGHWDPHVWMDVSAWSRAVTVVANALGEYDPDHQVDYQKHAAAYQAQLAELDDYVRRVIGSIPESKRILVTAHDAFNYFARAYGMQVEGVQGISTESEAGLKRINGLVDLLVDRKISAVFRESSVSAKHVDALIDGARSRGHTVAYGGELFSDAMGATGTYEGTYIGMLDHNATTIARALGGEAPKKGLNGELTLVGQAH
ncbi:MAG: manganese transporter [Planctomycetaceae bacterium]|nr:manganese transporter [Planctomycetaceae bacterium]